MNDRLPISQVLPGRLMHRALKEDVIAYLARTPLTVAQRRKLFRRWCTFAQVSVLRADLDRVGTTRPLERQAALWE